MFAGIAFRRQAPYNIPHMAKETVHFPQITRVFSAFTLASVWQWSERVVLWAVLIAFIIVNLSTAKNHPSKLSELLAPSLTNPFSIAQHVTTAKHLWDLGYRETATRELVIAQGLVEAGGSVLGATSNPTTLLAQWELEPSRLKAAYEYWKSVTDEQPDYRDGFLIAGSYAYQLGNITEASSMAQKAYALDPNYKPTIEILGKIK